MTAKIDEINSNTLKTTKEHSLLLLYIAAFFFAFQDNAILVAISWQLMKLGGSEVAVGAAGTLTFGCYIVCCVLAASKLGRLGAKRLTIASTSITCITLAVMPLTTSVGVLLCLMAFKGLVMSAFWPPAMSWSSAGAHGKKLNSRIGRFNLAWCSGAIVGSFLGGFFFNIIPWLPFAVSTLTALLAALILIKQHEPSKEAFENITAPSDTDKLEANTNENNTDKDETVLKDPPELAVFKRISQIGLAFGWIVFAALRVPIASLFKEINLDANIHAMSAAGMSLVLLIAFHFVGRFSGWHYKFSTIIIAQLILIAIVTGVGMVTDPNILILLISLSAVPLAFIYSSHLYYIVSGKGHRQGSTAIHEITLGIGFCIGSLGAGGLGRYLGGMREVYLVIAGVILVTLIAQIVIYLMSKRTMQNGA